MMSPQKRKRTGALPLGLGAVPDRYYMGDGVQQPASCPGPGGAAGKDNTCLTQHICLDPEEYFVFSPILSQLLAVSFYFSLVFSFVSTINLFLYLAMSCFVLSHTVWPMSLFPE